MIFVVGKDGKLEIEAEPKSPDVYRMTPYEFAETAEPVQQVVSCVQPIRVQSSTISTVVKNSIRALPASMIRTEKLSA